MNDKRYNQPGGDLYRELAKARRIVRCILRNYTDDANRWERAAAASRCHERLELWVQSEARKEARP